MLRQNIDEMKNKYNTMASARASIYEKMKKELSDNDNRDSACFLVEVITKSKKSKNIEWRVNRQSNKRIRRVSIDEFYKLVTGQDDAFYQLCKILPREIKKVMKEFKESRNAEVEKNPEPNEFSKDAESQGSYESALYSLAFKGYLGFSEGHRQTTKSKSVCLR